MPIKPYHTYLIESLKDPEEHILLALKNVAEARRELVSHNSNHDLTWENCYQSIAQGQPIALPTIAHLLNELGLKLSVTIKEGRAA
jgi:DNA-binding phage protein